MKQSNEIYLLKALAIIAVVVGNSEAPFKGVIFLYHLPLFFFAAGFFYEQPSVLNPFKQTIKYLKALYLPFLAYELVFLFLHKVFYNLKIHEAPYTGGEFLAKLLSILGFQNQDQLLYGFWFLTCLFIVEMAFLGINYGLAKLKFLTGKFGLCLGQTQKEVGKVGFRSEGLRAGMVFLLFLAGNLANYYEVELGYQVNTALIALLIYYLGYLYRRYSSPFSLLKASSHITKIAPYNSYLVAVAVLVLILNSSFSQTNMAENYYSNPAFFLINALLGLYINLFLAKLILAKAENSQKLVGRKVYDILAYIGRNTLTILALHFLSYKLVGYLQIKLYNLSFEMLSKFPVISGGQGWWIAYSIVGVFVPIGLKYGYDKTFGTLRSNRKRFLQEHKGV